MVLLPLTGAQGDKILSGQQHNIDDAECTGLLLLRTYAVTDHKRLLLVVLGVLICGFIIPAVVCIHVCMSAAICDGQP
jgi:hypothetical protein